jgi:hypothetical protein
VRVTLDGGADDAIRPVAADILAIVQRLHTEPFAVPSFTREAEAAVAPEPAVVGDLWMGDSRHPVTHTVTSPEWSLDAAA